MLLRMCGFTARVRCILNMMSLSLILDLAGTGKSVLCAATIETLTSPSPDQQHLALKETIYIAYYFFEGGGTKRSSVIDMIRCLILQLSRYFEKLPPIITEFYDRFASDQTLKAEPSERMCLDVLVGLLDLTIIPS